MTTSIDARLEALCARGDVDAAARLLLQGAAADDADALYTLAMWRIEGSLIRRNLTVARAAMGRAALRGRGDAALLFANMLANGTGGPPEWPTARAVLERLAPSLPRAAEQLALLEKMEIAADGAPLRVPSGRELSASPFVALAEQLLTAAECDYLRRHSEGRLEPSLVVDPRSGRSIPHPIRRSDGAMFGVLDEDLVVNAINRRVASLSGTGTEQGEALQILRYRPGGEYRAHMDAVPGTDNQRIATVIMYLNEDYEGGETRFLASGLSIRAKKGDALLFRNVTASGAPDSRTQHAGMPVTKGTKLIATRWIRQRRLVFPPPVPATANRFP